MKADQYSRYNSVKVKARASYLCQMCGSDYMVQAHAPNGDHSDWRKGVALCAECHSKEHPGVPRTLFFTKNHQPYWYNVSANSLAREFGCHTRTVIRWSKRLGISGMSEISEEGKQLLRQSIRSRVEKSTYGYNIGGMANPVVLPEFNCLRCGHRWVPRNPVYPKLCPKCKSFQWDRPKVRE